MQIFTVTFEDTDLESDAQGMAVVVADDEGQAGAVILNQMVGVVITNVTKIGSGLAPGRVVMFAWDEHDDD